MNTNPDRHTTRVTGSVRARRVATLSVAGVLAALALAPTSALADHPTSEGVVAVPLASDLAGSAFASRASLRSVVSYM